MADTAGAVAGPLAALAIVGLTPSGAGDLHSFNVIFWLAAIPGILAALSIVALVSEREHPILKDKSFFGALWLLPSSYRLAGVFIFGCGDFSHTMLILYAVQALAPLYGQGAGAIAIELYALHNVLYAVGAYPVGVLADRYGKRGFLLAAWALGAITNQGRCDRAAWRESQRINPCYSIAQRRKALPYKAVRLGPCAMRG